MYYEGIWLGLTDKAKEGQFVWDASGATANYTNWVAGEPNNSPLVGGENCVQMLPGNGQWNDMLCSPSYSEVHLQQFTMCETQIKGTVGHYWSGIQMVHEHTIYELWSKYWKFNNSNYGASDQEIGKLLDGR